MFFHIILQVVFSLSFLSSFCVSSCGEECEDQPKFTPSRLVVKFGDPTSASCSVCQQACVDKFAGLEKNVGDVAVNGTTILWRVDSMTEWDTTPQCYYNSNSGQCCSSLPVIVYQPPENVSISLKSHTGPMFAGRQYTLQCTVQNVAPVENLSVTFYRGERKLGKSPSKDNKEKKPVTEIFTLSFSPSEEDDGVQYWCEAKLEFGLEGPQPPPVVTSQNITAAVYYKPQLKESSHLGIITIIEGNPLQLDCSAVGNPSPSYSWTLPTGSISPSGGSVLTIKSVTSADKGLYSCSVSNQVGTITVEFRVVVQCLELTSARLSTRLSPTTKPATPTRLTTRRTITTQTTTTRSSSTSSTLIHSHIVFYAFILYSGLS